VIAEEEVGVARQHRAEPRPGLDFSILTFDLNQQSGFREADRTRDASVTAGYVMGASFSLGC
jgi:hypothetical protein